jgi:hypothetical protein
MHQGFVTFLFSIQFDKVGFFKQIHMNTEIEEKVEGVHLNIRVWIPQHLGHNVYNHHLSGFSIFG